MNAEKVSLKMAEKYQPLMLSLVRAGVP